MPGRDQTGKSSELKFTKLVKTGEMAGTLSFQEFMDNRENPVLMKVAQGDRKGPQIIAARITGKLPEDKRMSDAGADERRPQTRGCQEPASGARANRRRTCRGTAEGGRQAGSQGDEERRRARQDHAEPRAKTGGQAEASKPEAKEPKERGLDVVYVADIDLMIPAFLRIRARPGEDEEISWQFENVNFLLNIIDVLSGDDDYIEIRKRKPKHSTLRMVEVGARMPARPSSASG